ncbi:MAG: M48 family metallopeptidase [Rhizobacter sp.]
MGRRDTVDPGQGALFGDAAPATSGRGGPERAEAGPIGGAATAPSVSSHPDAQRRVLLGGKAVGYALQRGRRRSIGFVVGAEGLSVKAPSWVPIRDIEAALQARAGWVLRKLAEQQEQSRRRLAARVEWRDGASLPFLGEPLIVVLGARAVEARRGALPAIKADRAADSGTLCLHLALGPAASPQQISDAVQSWLQQQARRIFDERCRAFAERLQVRCTRLALSSAGTRWGSASPSGAIRLNWRLVHFDLPTIDYVVVHELAHLREMNHGRRFWDLVGSVLPDYEQRRLALRAAALPQFED